MLARIANFLDSRIKVRCESIGALAMGIHSVGFLLNSEKCNCTSELGSHSWNKDFLLLWSNIQDSNPRPPPRASP